VGTGVDIPRALIRLAALLALAGCIDFVEPELPGRGAPAVLQLIVRLRELSEVEVEGRLVPGLDEGGIRRRLADERIRVMGREFGPDSTSKTGTRVYRASWTASGAGFAGAIEARGPGLAGLDSAPGFRWYTLRRRGPAEVALGPSADLPLPVDLDPGAAQPEPEIRQWFLMLAGAGQVFRLGADGPPPSTILVPAHWVPAGDSVAVMLIYQQSSEVEMPPGGYIGLLTLDTRISWTVRRTTAAGNGEG